MNKQILNVALALALSGSALSAHAASYTFTDLGTLGGDYTHSYARAINTAGQVAGSSYTSYTSSNNLPRATVWNGTTATDLGMLGDNFSNPYAINDAGQVAGWSANAANGAHATVWNGTTATYLGKLPGGTEGVAYAINSAGQVAGRAFTATNALHATIWNGTTATDLGTLGGTTSEAHAINDAGQVAGWSLTANAHRATVWNGGTATDLGTLGGPSSEALAINDAGQVAGWSNIANDPYYNHRATIWNGATATDLGALKGGDDSEALAINTAGQVVGWSGGNLAGPNTRAIIWNGATTDLNSFLDANTVSAGWVLTKATGINDNGWIVGDASNSLLGIESHAFLLTPVPEAETWAMMLAGLGLVGFAASRRQRSALRII